MFRTDGILMVDTADGPVAEKILKAIRTFRDARIKIVFNSHIHSGHTGGNTFPRLRVQVLHSPATQRQPCLTHRFAHCSRVS